MPNSMPNSTPDFDSEELELHALVGRPAQPCPPVDLLLAHSEGALPPELAQRIQQHLDQCQLCPALLADLATLPEAAFTPGQQQRIAARLPSTSPGDPASIDSHETSQPRRNFRAYAAIAAAVLVCIMAGTEIYLNHHHAPQVAQAPPPTPVSAPVVAALEIPLSPLAPPDGAAPLTRGHGSADPSIDELLPAFEAYNAADYATAAKDFTSLKKSYPHSEIVLLYLGVSQLFLHNDSEANATLAVARQAAPPKFADAADWYSAIAAQRLHSADAKGLLQSLCAKPGSKYSAESCRIVATLP